MKTIWCLFSIANEYNQPEHNLVKWWSVKPNGVEWFKYFNRDLETCSEDELLKLVDGLKGVPFKFEGSHCEYTLQEVSEEETLND